MIEEKYIRHNDVRNRFFAVNDSCVANNTFETKFGPAHPKISIGDQIVFFIKDFNKIEFISSSVVVEVNIKMFDDVRIATIRFGKIDKFEEPRDLYSIAGSLKKVYRFMHPERHFIHRIVKLEWQDYEVIVKNKIDIERSVFRYLFSCLPKKIQVEFLQTYYEDIGISPTGLINDYSKPCELLILFYQNRIGKTLKILTDFCSIHEKVEKNVPQLPGLYALRLTSHDGKDILDFGSLAGKAKDFYTTSNLFKEQEGMNALLSEAKKYLNEEGEIRKWQDQIF